MELHTPDFAALGQAMGLPSRRVATAQAFEEAFAEAMAMAGPNLIEIDISGMAPLAM